MSGQAALSDATLPRVLVVDDTRTHEVFEVLGLSDDVIRVRTAFLFEIGEQLRVRVVSDGSAFEATARVRAHVGPDDARITELELVERSEPKKT
jgi:hypothetical protein